MIKLYTVCLSVYIFWTYTCKCMIKLHCPKSRIILDSYFFLRCHCLNVLDFYSLLCSMFSEFLTGSGRIKRSASPFAFFVGRMPPTGDLKNYVKDLSSKNKVLIFSKSTCPFCTRVSVIIGPAHEIMALFVLRKLILQRRMCRHSVGLDV